MLDILLTTAGKELILLYLRTIQISYVNYFSLQRLLEDFSLHIKELEDKRARGLPIISLVDNMVKLGSLYRGPQDAPLSHRIRNIPTTPSISSNNTNFNAISYNNGPHQSSTREQLSKYQKNEIQVSNL